MNYSKIKPFQVLCMKDFSKSMGYLHAAKKISENICFRKNTAYIAYIDEDNLFVVSETKTPELVLNGCGPRVFEDEPQFSSYFEIIP